MRTTISLNDDLLIQAKREAASQRRSLANLVEDALKRFLAQNDDRTCERHPVVLPESGEGGLLPGIDLANSSDLLMAMETHDDAYGR